MFQDQVSVKHLLGRPGEVECQTYAVQVLIPFSEMAAHIVILPPRWPGVPVVGQCLMPLARLNPASSTKTEMCYFVSFHLYYLYSNRNNICYFYIDYYRSLVNVFVVIDIYNFKKYAQACLKYCKAPCTIYQGHTNGLPEHTITTAPSLYYSSLMAPCRVVHSHLIVVVIFCLQRKC